MNGPACFLIIGTLLLFLVGGLIVAPRDTIRAWREFFEFRAIRSALRQPIAVLAVVAVLMALLLTVAIGLAQLAGNAFWFQRLSELWVGTIMFIAWYLFVALAIWSYRDVFPDKEQSYKRRP
jgi:hypothetical protein